MPFSAAETENCRRLIEWALREDLADAGDVTSTALIDAAQPGQADLVARQEGVIAGLPAAALVFATVNPHLRFETLIEDGSKVGPGARVATVTGPMCSILTGERTALNFVQRLSGVASLTRQFVDAIAGLPGCILDTRKTTPGWRLLEKYAVRLGGGTNHRLGLYDGILIKDNHLAALGGSIEAAIRRARGVSGGSLPVEVEVDTLEQLDEALANRPDIVLLDNFSAAELREAVRRRDARSPGVLLEASGGITLGSVRDKAASGVDRVSVGALTHSATALDVALDYQRN
ncbi:MAG: carboxylating nicotinate-nucleotide diphosphorylase [Gemmataceae bacterium]